jgi:hypothetical protein
MKTFLKTALVLMSLPALAETVALTSMSGSANSVKVSEVKSRGAYLQEIEFNINSIEASSNFTRPEFTVVSAKNISFTQNVGSPSLPFKALVVAGKPSEISITLDQGPSVDLNMIVSPSQEEDCRCEVPKSKKWKFSERAQNMTKVEYLGKYRGQDLSRVTFTAAETDFDRGTTRFYPQMKAVVASNASLAEVFSSELASDVDYLIVSPASLLGGLTDLVSEKTNAGFKVKTVKVEDIGNDVAKLTAFFKAEFARNPYKYALIVGNDALVVNHKVDTSGSSSTPSDYPYFLMDSNDMIPDVQYGRVIAGSVDEVARQAKKWIGYAAHSSPASQYLKMIGIASNEGNAPSDEEYVVGIENDMKAAFGTTATHFAQNSPTSRPEQINKALGEGASYLVYLGHGSGTSWGSTGTSYSNTHIKQLTNSKVLQPVIIDVACMNGVLRKGYFGETWLNATNAQGEAIGASMYYGGSVNISWHPPAIMAKGMVKKAVSLGLSKVGDVLLAGQIYLLENYTEKEGVRDNFEWYHLFGEPSSPFHFK